MAVVIFLACGMAHAGPQTTSSSTGTQIIERARYLLREPSTDLKRWTQAELTQYLNDGIADLASKTKCVQTTESITLVGGTIEYTPTGNYIGVVSVLINPASGSKWWLKKKNFDSLGTTETDDLDAPGFWYEFDGKIGIYPPYTTVTTQTATAYLATLPTVIAIGGTVPTPAVFDVALVYFIASQALLADRRYQEAANYMSMYENQVARYRKDFVNADNETIEPIR